MNQLFLNSITFAEQIVALFSGLGVWYIVLYNAFGISGLTIKAIEIQLKSRNVRIVLACLAALSWVLYFILQGNFTSGVISIINIICLLLFLQRGKYKWAESKFWLYFFIAVQVCICVLTYSNWTSFLSTSAGICSLFAYFTKSNKVYRFWTLALCLCWLANSIANFYVVAFAADCTATISAIISIIRYSKKEKSENLLNN